MALSNPLVPRAPRQKDLDTRRHIEIVSAIFNGILRDGDVEIAGPGDFRVSPQLSLGRAGPPGPAGARGQDANRWLTGIGPPAASLGRAGDLYVDRTAKLVWEKRSPFFGVPPRWRKCLSLVAGAPGPKGEPGERGPMGLPGPAGASGASATTGWGSVYNLTAPVNGDFSWVNQGTASVTSSGGGLFLRCPVSASLSIRARVKTAPATPYTITAAFLPVLIGLNYQNVGIGWRESGTGKMHVFVFNGRTPGVGVGGFNLVSTKLTDATTFSADYTLAGQVRPYLWGSPAWARIADDGVNRICSFSNDGTNWFQFHSIGRTDFLTGGADQVLFFADDETNTYECGMTLLSWVQG